MTVTKRSSANPLVVVLILSAVFFFLFVMASAVFYITRVSPDGSPKPGGSLFSQGSVGVVEIKGVILDSKKILKQLDRFEESSKIKAVVVRLNSPGGAVAPSQEIYQAVKRFKKPLVVSMGSVAASGAFYIACGAKKIFANPGTITGSIGVIMEFANLEKLYEWAKIRRYALKTGKFKDAGSDYREMTPEEKALFQGMIDDVQSQFRKAVAEGRKLSLQAVEAVADGRVFSGNQAKAFKLVDELGGIDDAVREAAKMAGLSGKPSVVYPDTPRRNRFLDLLFSPSPDEESSDAQFSAGPWWLPIIVTLLGTQEAASRTVSSPGVSYGPGLYWLWRGAY